MYCTARICPNLSRQRFTGITHHHTGSTEHYSAPAPFLARPVAGGASRHCWRGYNTVVMDLSHCKEFESTLYRTFNVRISHGRMGTKNALPDKLGTALESEMSSAFQRAIIRHHTTITAYTSLLGAPLGAKFTPFLARSMLPLWDYCCNEHDSA